MQCRRMKESAEQLKSEACEVQGATDWTLILRVDRTEGLKEDSLWTALLALGLTWAAAGLGTAGLISEDRDCYTHTHTDRETERDLSITRSGPLVVLQCGAIWWMKGHTALPPKILYSGTAVKLLADIPAFVV